MHILTKVFVLFASVLSVLMASLAISYTVNADRVRSEYHDATQGKVAAQASQAAQRDIHARQSEALNDEIATFSNELASRDAQIRALELQTSQLTSRVRQAEAARESISSKIAQLAVTADTQAELISSYKDENERLRTEQVRAQNEKLDLENRNSDLTTQNQVFVQTMRSLQEQLTSARAQIIVLSDGGKLGKDEVAREIPGPLVRGRIDRVEFDKATGDQIVQLNLGSNDRVGENIRLYVHRENQYLGDVVIFRVDLNSSVGRIRFQISGVEIRPGDQVLSRIGS